MNFAVPAAAAVPCQCEGRNVSYAPVPWPDIRQRYQAPVAQLDRAPDYEFGGQEFESLRARHQF